MKNKKKIFLVIIVSLTIIISLIISKPSNTMFDDWIVDEYQIECKGQECILNSNRYKIAIREDQNYLLFNKKASS